MGTGEVYADFPKDETYFEMMFEGFLGLYAIAGGMR
jgi:hypothetical protein